MRPVEWFLGGAIVLVLGLSVAALLGDGLDGAGDDQDDEAVEDTEPGAQDGGRSDDRDVVEQPDQPRAEPGPRPDGATPDQPGAAGPEPSPDAGSEEGVPGGAQPDGDAIPAPGEPPRQPRPDGPAGQEPRIALEDQPGTDASLPDLPETGGEVPAAVGVALLAASALAGLVRIRVSR